MHEQQWPTMSVKVTYANLKLKLRNFNPFLKRLAGYGVLTGGTIYNTTYYNTSGDLVPDKENICNDKIGLGAAVHKASVFLYSFTIEYSIIAGAMFFIMWKNIGRRVSRNKNTRNHEYSFNFECGLLLGVICAMCGGIILVLNIVYLGAESSKSATSYTSYHGYRTFLNIVCISACIGSFVGIHKGSWRYERKRNPSHTIDTFLLLLCVTGSIIQGFYTLVASAKSVGQERYAGLIFFDEMTHMAQAVLQCVLIMDAIHRRPPPGERNSRTKQTIMFLLVCNITWWLLSTYELKGGYDIFPLENMYYGRTCWYVVVHLAGPFDILFRFHSTVMFFDIWSLESKEDVYPHGYI